MKNESMNESVNESENEKTDRRRIKESNGLLAEPHATPLMRPSVDNTAPTTIRATMMNSSRSVHLYISLCTCDDLRVYSFAWSGRGILFDDWTTTSTPFFRSLGIDI